MIDFTQPADIVAPQLLGTALSHGDVTIRITEVEAYLGATDPAAHTYRGMTKQNRAMFGPPGRLYVYRSYGIHLACNIVCAPEGDGQGCLLRAGEVIHGIPRALDRPPRRRPRAHARRGHPRGCGRGAALGLNGVSIFSARLGFINRVAEPEIVVGPRIGISKNADAPLRFWIPNHPTVSARKGYPPSLTA